MNFPYPNIQLLIAGQPKNGWIVDHRRRIVLNYLFRIATIQILQLALREIKKSCVRGGYLVGHRMKWESSYRDY